MQCEAVKQHHWLRKFVGQWTYEGACVMDPSAPMKFKGVERVRAIGDLWIVGESTGEIPGGATATMILTLGFDPKKDRFVGTWIGSMAANLWVYDGHLDGGERVLTLETQGHSMTNPEKTTRYKDITEWKSDDHRAFRSVMLKDDGEWKELVSMEFRRIKG